MGPDGQLYAVVSTEDQDVLVVRMELSEELPPMATPAPYVEPTPMGRMAPAWDTPPAGASQEEVARETLIRFLSLLDSRDYLAAAELYGGGMEGFERFRAEYPEFYEQVASLEGDPEQFWQSACSLLLACYSAGRVVSIENQRPAFVEVSWTEPDILVFGDEEFNSWRYRLSSGELVREDRFPQDIYPPFTPFLNPVSGLTANGCPDLNNVETVEDLPVEVAVEVLNAIRSGDLDTFKRSADTSYWPPEGKRVGKRGPVNFRSIRLSKRLTTV